MAGDKEIKIGVDKESLNEIRDLKNTIREAKDAAREIREAFASGSKGVAKVEETTKQIKDVTKETKAATTETKKLTAAKKELASTPSLADQEKGFFGNSKVTQTIKDTTKAIEEQTEAMKLFEKYGIEYSSKGVGQLLNAALTGGGDITKVTSLFDDKEIYDLISDGKEMTDALTTANAKFANILTTFPEATGRQMAALSLLGPALDNIGLKQSRVNTVMKLAANYTSMNEKEQAALKFQYGDIIPQVEQYSNSTQHLVRSQQMLETYHRSSRASIGLVGTAFREVTQQIYWAALGMLFYTMTLSRQDQASVTSATRTLSLAKGLYGLAEAQKAANDAMMEYGEGSEEAGAAQVRYKQALLEYNLQQRSLSASLKSEAISGVQMWLTTIPLIINSMYALMTVMGSARGIGAAFSQQKLYDATVTLLQKGAIDSKTASEALETVTKAKSNVATTSGSIIETIAIGVKMGLTNAIRGVTAALHNQALVAEVVKFGIFGLISATVIFTGMQVLQAKINADVNSQLEEQAEKMKDLAGEWSNLAGLGSEYGTVIEDIQGINNSNNGMLSLGKRYAEPVTLNSNIGSSRGGNFNTVNISYPDAKISSEIDVNAMSEQVATVVVRELDKNGVRV